METALLSIKNDIHLSLSRGEATALVLLDLSAAVDTIDHSTLLSCGLVRCWWFRSQMVLFLFDRTLSIC